MKSGTFKPIHEGLRYSWERGEWGDVALGVLLYPFMALYNWAADRGF